MLIPITKLRPMLVAGVTGGITAVVLRGMPLRLGVIMAIIAGIGAGFLAERWQSPQEAT